MIWSSFLLLFIGWEWVNQATECFLAPPHGVTNTRTPPRISLAVMRSAAYWTVNLGHPHFAFGSGAERREDGPSDLFLYPLRDRAGQGGEDDVPIEIHGEAAAKRRRRGGGGCPAERRFHGVHLERMSLSVARACSGGSEGRKPMQRSAAGPGTIVKRIFVPDASICWSAPASSGSAMALKPCSVERSHLDRSSGRSVRQESIVGCEALPPDGEGEFHALQTAEAGQRRHGLGSGLWTLRRARGGWRSQKGEKGVEEPASAPGGGGRRSAPSQRPDPARGSRFLPQTLAPPRWWQA